MTNKADNERRENERWEFLALGAGDPYPVSALHGRRAGDLLDEVISLLPVAEDEEDDAPGVDLEDATELWKAGDQPPPRVAIVGRPNVGKSTLFNRLVGSDRSVVHDMAGTTATAIDTLVDTPDGPIVFVDTAGMRRRSRIDDSAEYYSVVRALRAIDGADIALARHRRHRRHHQSGSATGRARRRRRLSDRGHAQQVGADRGSRATAAGAGGVEAQAVLRR